MGGGGWEAPAQFDVLGVKVSAVNMGSALALIRGWIAAGERHYVCVTGVHGVMESRRDSALRDIHNRAGLVTPDGMPLVWLGRLQGARHVDRVYGPDLLQACCAQGLTSGWTHFFFGGGTGIAGLLVERLRHTYPGLKVAGTFTPPFSSPTPKEDLEAVESINSAAPDILWVGLSTPKQERWMAEHIGRLQARVIIGVGAAFDFVSGAKRQAPKWMRRNGLEWLFRLLTEPRRLAGRYLINNPAFVWYVTLDAMRRPRHGRTTASVW